MQFSIFLCSDPLVTLLDAGIVLELSPKQSSNFWSLFRALLARDSVGAANLILDRGGRVPGSTDEIQFRREVEKSIAFLLFLPFPFLDRLMLLLRACLARRL